jgi:hypothetical protein
MMQLETGPPDRVRVIGALTGAALETLLEMVKTTDVLLDLSRARALASAGATPRRSPGGARTRAS